MVQALTKAGVDGPLLRPKGIESQISVALRLPPASLKARLSVTDRDNPEFLQSETLVHLVRHGRRTNNQTMISLVMPVLLNRCETNLLVKVPDGQLPEAASLREEILGAFSELFAIDGTDDASDELDFYECKFNRAFRFFRIDIVRRETARLKPMAQMPEPNQDGEPDAYEDVFARVSETFLAPATQENEVFRTELARCDSTTAARRTRCGHSRPCRWLQGRVRRSRRGDRCNTLQLHRTNDSQPTDTGGGEARPL